MPRRGVVELARCASRRRESAASSARASGAGVDARRQRRCGSGSRSGCPAASGRWRPGAVGAISSARAEGEGAGGRGPARARWRRAARSAPRRSSDCVAELDASRAEQRLVRRRAPARRRAAASASRERSSAARRADGADRADRRRRPPSARPGRSLAVLARRHGAHLAACRDAAPLAGRGSCARASPAARSSRRSSTSPPRIARASAAMPAHDAAPASRRRRWRRRPAPGRRGRCGSP